MSRIIERLKNQWLLKLLSLALAISLWAYVRENPSISKQIDVPVATINTPRGLVVLSKQPDEIEVTVQSQRGSLSESVLDTIRLVADLSGTHVGQQQVPVELHGVLGDVEAIPHKRLVMVTLDKLDSKQRPVIVELRGIPAEGYSAQAPQVQPNEVTVRGPSSLVRSVARVVAVADISGYSATAQLQASVEARDERNVAISGLHVQPAQVQVTISMTKLVTRTVLVKPLFSAPPAGYQISSVQASPTTVPIAGDADKVKRVEYLSTERIDISRLRGKRTVTVHIDFPDGIESMGVGAVSITVVMQKLPSPPEGAEGEVTPEEPSTPEEEPAVLQPGEEDSEPAPTTPSEADSSGPASE